MRLEIAEQPEAVAEDPARTRRAGAGAGGRGAKARGRPGRPDRAWQLGPCRDLRALPARGAVRHRDRARSAEPVHHVPRARRPARGARHRRLAVGRDARDRVGARVCRLPRRVDGGRDQRGRVVACAWCRPPAPDASRNRAVGRGDQDLHGTARRVRGPRGRARRSGAVRRARRAPRADVRHARTLGGGGRRGRAVARPRRRRGLRGAGIQLRRGARGGAEAEGDLRDLGGGLLVGRSAPRADRGGHARDPGARLPRRWGARVRRRAARGRAACPRCCADLDRPRTRRADGRAPCEELAPFTLVLPAQLIAERLARLRGRDPDRPSGLDKVTQTF